MRIAFLVLLIFMCGCAGLNYLIEEASQISGEEIGASSSAVGVLLGDSVVDPYKMPASMAVGYILCLLRRLYKKKKGSLG